MFAEAKSSKRSQRFIVSQTQAQSKLFKNLKLRKRDWVKKFNNKPVKSYKRFLTFLKKSKSKNRFRLLIVRKNKYLQFSYLTKGGRVFSKKSYQLLNISSAVIKSKKNSTKTDKLFNKHKKKLQTAYTLQTESFIYDRPDFDGIQLTSLRPGKVVTISKKLYYPVTRFGSFYKIFIKKPKKIVGYVSEVDVISEFKKQGGEFILNPRFALAKKYKGNLGRADETPTSRKSLFSFLQRNQIRYIGVSSAILIKPAGLDTKNIQIGLNLNAYQISSVNLDFNAMFKLGSTANVSLDILGVYDQIQLLQQVPLRLGAGVRTTFQMLNGQPVLENTFLMGLIGLRIPINQMVSFKTHIQYGYGKDYLKRVLSNRWEAFFALQVPF